MPEFRQNLATREWVIIARESSLKPEDFTPPLRGPQDPIPHRRSDCPFCPGNEAATPTSVFTLSTNDHWSLRVVPNKFAALSEAQDHTAINEGCFLKAGGYGIAEVVIETPRHDLTIASMEDSEVARIVQAYKTRALSMEAKPDIRLVTIFRNYGPLAGTSIEHPHSQLIATPIVPPHVDDPIQKAREYFRDNKHCVFCAILEEELSQSVRILDQNEHFVAFCPFASHTPFETRIYPKRHAPSFTLISEDEVTAFARILQRTMARIHLCLGVPNYNYLIRSAPAGNGDADEYHWYFVVLPRITTPAGFEIGTGIFVNSVPPEMAAAYLRDCDPEAARFQRKGNPY
ncbi:MAG: DUF4931 domain-containing protein [Candidatus Eisenbacteria bacterium]|uniref:DUF4931 domain-containing protein n=1 Tax=Eiseniibacteriota bacterium TaxID=2212470 RepID=A0A948RU66_UNCEI|nr:DUF4931 domain-containing protein [Candidatus Eisenbacteria bacterium]MBU2691083.1 DUF4931 domain-containing protein [Candidatus Eisenbacteria bacterium]